MGIEQELTVERILRMNKVLASATTKEGLDGRVTYRLGRFKSRCESTEKQVRKSRNDLFRRYATEKNSNGQSRIPLDKIEDYNRELQEILEVVETIRVPEFRLSDFVADKDGKRISVVNADFFSVMDGFVIDDSEDERTEAS